MTGGLVGVGRLTHEPTAPEIRTPGMESNDKLNTGAGAGAAVEPPPDEPPPGAPVMTKDRSTGVAGFQVALPP